MLKKNNSTNATFTPSFPFSSVKMLEEGQAVYSELAYKLNPDNPSFWTHCPKTGHLWSLPLSSCLEMKRVYKNSKCQRLQLSLSNVSLILYKQVNGWHSWRIWSVSKIRFWKANNLDSSATLLGTPVKLRVKANF